MTYEQLVEKTREVFGKADASGIKEHVAYQFNITGEAEGAFYLEINEGRIRIEPYEYYDRDVIFVTTAEDLIKIGLGELDPVWAFTTGKIKVEGNLDKALLLKDLSASIKEQIAEEKAKEPEIEEKAEEKEEEPETEEKTEEKAKEPETEEKAEEKEEEPKTEEKTEEKAEEPEALEKTESAERKEEAPESAENQNTDKAAAGRSNIEMRNRGKKRSNRKKKRR